MNNFVVLLKRVGRLGLASLFVLGGINKLVNYAEVLESMGQAGLEPATLLLPLTIILELSAGLMIAVQFRLAWVAALTLGFFTLATNVYFHSFWDMDGLNQELHLSLFFKNVAIAGALFFAASRFYSDELDMGRR